MKLSGPPPETMKYELVKSEKVFVDGIEAKKEFFKGRLNSSINGENFYYIRIFIKEKEIFYQGDCNDSELEEFLSIYNNVLSTFKFIE